MEFIATYEAPKRAMGRVHLTLDELTAARLLALLACANGSSETGIGIRPIGHPTPGLWDALKKAVPVESQLKLVDVKKEQEFFLDLLHGYKFIPVIPG